MSAAGIGLAAGQVLGALFLPAAAPLQAVGASVVDLAPTALKEWAVAAVGTADKPLLLATVAVATLALGALAGHLAGRRRAFADLVWAGLGAVGVAAALTRPGSGPAAALPSLVAAALAATVLRGLLGRAGQQDAPRAGIERRLLLTGAAGVLATLATAGLPGSGTGLRGPSAPIRIPPPARRLPALPAGLEQSVPGISPLRTPTPDFYRIDTALFVPRPDPAAWRLSIDGLVGEPYELSFAELVALPMVERDITLTCVSNEIGGPYCGSTRWAGVLVADLLRRARPDAAADMVLSTSADGFTAGTPLAALLDGRDAMIAVSMDGAPLTAEHGFPARLLTPGLYGFVGATKWLTRLTVTTFARDRSYWTVRGWAEQAPVKTATRIDTPRGRVAAGPVVVGGVAWATHRGVSRVQVRVDDGEWQDARLGPDVGVDYWRQWAWEWTAGPGTHTVAARAVDGEGVVQPEQRQGVLPDGPTGYHVLTVTVG